MFSLGWLWFAVAVTLVEPVVATVLFECWPILFGLFTLSKLWRGAMLEGEPRTTAGTTRMLTLLVVGASGVSLAVLSDTTTVGWTATSAVGVLVAVLGASWAALATATAQMMGANQRDGYKRDKTAVSASGQAAVKALVAGPIALVGAVSAAAGSSDWWSVGGLLFAVAAAAAQVAGNWCFQHANHLSREVHGQVSAQINTLYYGVPVGALLLLVWLADTTIERPDLLIVGAAGVVAVNMVLNLDPEGAQQRASGGGQGFQALVLALWAAGAAVLLRDDWLPGSWQVWSVLGVLGDDRGVRHRVHAHSVVPPVSARGAATRNGRADAALAPADRVHGPMRRPVTAGRRHSQPVAA